MQDPHPVPAPAVQPCVPLRAVAVSVGRNSPAADIRWPVQPSLARTADRGLLPSENNPARLTGFGDLARSNRTAPAGSIDTPRDPRDAIAAIWRSSPRSNSVESQTQSPSRLPAAPT